MNKMCLHNGVSKHRLSRRNQYHAPGLLRSCIIASLTIVCTKPPSAEAVRALGHTKGTEQAHTQLHESFLAGIKSTGLLGKHVTDGTWYLRHDATRNAVLFMLRHPLRDDLWTSTAVLPNSSTIAYSVIRHAPMDVVLGHTSFKGRVGSVTTGVGQKPFFFKDHSRPAPHMPDLQAELTDLLFTYKRPQESFRRSSKIGAPPRQILEWANAVREDIQWQRFRKGRRNSKMKTVIEGLGSIDDAKGRLNVGHDVLEIIQLIRRIQNFRGDDRGNAQKALETMIEKAVPGTDWADLLDDWYERLQSNALSTDLVFILKGDFLHPRFAQLEQSPDIVAFLVDPANETFVHQSEGLVDLLRSQTKDTDLDNRLFLDRISTIDNWEAAVHQITAEQQKTAQQIARFRDPLIVLRPFASMVRDLTLANFTLDDAILSAMFPDLRGAKLPKKANQTAKWVVQVPQESFTTKTPQRLTDEHIHKAVNQLRQRIASSDSARLMELIYDGFFKGWRDAFEHWQHSVLKGRSTASQANWTDSNETADPQEVAKAVVAEINSILSGEKMPQVDANHALLPFGDAQDHLDTLSSLHQIIVDDDAQIESHHRESHFTRRLVETLQPSWESLRQALDEELAWTNAAIISRRDLISTTNDLLDARATDSFPETLIEHFLLNRLAQVNPEALAIYLDVALESENYLGKHYAMELLFLARDNLLATADVREQRSTELNSLRARRRQLTSLRESLNEQGKQTLKDALEHVYRTARRLDNAELSDTSALNFQLSVDEVKAFTEFIVSILQPSGGPK